MRLLEHEMKKNIKKINWKGIISLYNEHNSMKLMMKM